MRWALLLLVLMPLCGPNVASARVIFVDNLQGDDLASGREPQPGARGGPVATIHRALHLAGQGDRIVLTDTGFPYREAICLSGRAHRGWARRPFVIDGQGAVIEGTVVAEQGAWKHVHESVFAMRPRRLTYQQLFHEGKPLPHVRLTSHVEAAASLEPLQWTMQQGRMLLRVEPGRLPRDYDLRHAGLQTGVSLYNTQHVRIQNLIIQGFQLDGINARDNVRGCQLINVECRANGRSGISVGGCSRVEVIDSHSYDNGRVQFRIEEYARADLRRCDLGDESAPSWEILGGKLHIDGVRYEQ